METLALTRMATRRKTPEGLPRISAAEFKAKCLQIMDEVAATHRAVTITKYGKPVATLVPVNDELPDSFGALKGSVRYRGDIVAPDHESWNETAS